MGNSYDIAAGQKWLAEGLGLIKQGKIEDVIRQHRGGYSTMPWELKDT
jgi:hypothetical protein